MREKLAAESFTNSHQHLNAEQGASSTTSRQPTLYESTTEVQNTRVHWADGQQGQHDEA
jgi:hypothetical protein